MNTRIKTIGAIASAILAGGLGYAAAQQQPAKTQTAPPQGQSTTTNNACAGNCDCMMHDGMMMHGQNGMMGGQSGMTMSCPMAGMGGMADIKVENTKKGAVIHMDARKSEQVGQLQQMAQQMMHCLGSAQPDAAPAAPVRPKPATR